MWLGIVGQIGQWGIGYWSPELIRGSAMEQRQGKFVDTAPSASREDALKIRRLSPSELAAASTASREEAGQLLKGWKAEDDALVGRGTMLQDIGPRWRDDVVGFLAANRRVDIALSAPGGLVEPVAP